MLLVWICGFHEHNIRSHWKLLLINYTLIRFLSYLLVIHYRCTLWWLQRSRILNKFYICAEKDRTHSVVIDISHNADMSVPSTCAIAKGALEVASKNVFRCRPGARGRYLRVLMPTSQPRKLSLCEVQVKGKRGKRLHSDSWLTRDCATCFTKPINIAEMNAATIYYIDHNITRLWQQVSSYKKPDVCVNKKIFRLMEQVTTKQFVLRWRKSIGN